jgi:hypothetical protein
MTTGETWWALGICTSDLSRVKQGTRDPLTSALAAQTVFGPTQEFRLVPPDSVDSLTWC